MESPQESGGFAAQNPSWALFRLRHKQLLLQNDIMPIDPRRYFSREPTNVVTVDHPARREDPVVIYDFVGQTSHYTNTFGLQWKKYRDVQIDRLNGTQGSYNHLKVFSQ